MTLPETRHSLIVRLKCRDNEPAWQEFVAEYESFLRRLVQRQGVPDRHRSDVTQQVLMAIAQSIDGWKDDGRSASFRRWLSTVARNVVIRFMARERRHDAAGGTELLQMLRELPAAPDPQSVRQYQQEVIVWAAEQVRHEFQNTSWNAFVATMIDGEPVADVAQRLGVSAGSIYMSRSRILARIRQRVHALIQE